MSIRGKWRITEMPDYEADYPDMMEPAYIRFGKSGSESAFGCVSGAIHGAIDGNSVEFTWAGNDEMDQVDGNGWANCGTTVSSRDKFASREAMKPISSRAAGAVFQQPAKASFVFATTV